LDRLADAEKAFALGDDAGVFQHLNGVFEAVGSVNPDVRTVCG